MKTTPKHQLIIIDGGNSYNSDQEALDWLKSCDWDLMERRPSWKKWLADGLSESFETIRPSMPNDMNAKYEEWKVWFEKYFRYLNTQKLILIGHSLGGIFLAKYLSENTFPRKIDGLHLIAPVFDNSGLSEESTASFTFDPNNLCHIVLQVGKIHFWHSEDDTIVPFRHSEKYHHLLPPSIFHRFENRGHFIDQSHFVELFLEILKEVN